jgi:hypothetical protein
MVFIASASSAVFDLDGPPSPSATLTGLFHSGEWHQILSLERELRLKPCPFGFRYHSPLWRGAGLVVPHFLPPAGAGCFAVAHLRKRLPQTKPSPLGGSGHRLKPLPTRLIPPEGGLRAVPNSHLVSMTTCNHDVFNMRILLTNKLIISHLFGNEYIMPKI